jgi:2,4-dienoyl-CoA reductase-like NADH-dependent reductase (Old Yellow Enzyme family)
LTLPNRLVLSPPWQYNPDNGSAADWDLMHLRPLSLDSAALVMTETADVKAVGRIPFKRVGKEGEKWIA